MKRPAFQFYTGDWMKDPQVSLCSPPTRGIWLDLICAMHETGDGAISGTPQQLARLCRCTETEMTAAINELSVTKTANVTVCPGNVTISCRRMLREAKERNSNNIRKKRQRDAVRLESHADVTKKSRLHSSSSSSSSEEDNTNPPTPLAGGTADVGCKMLTDAFVDVHPPGLKPPRPEEHPIPKNKSATFQEHAPETPERPVEGRSVTNETWDSFQALDDVWEASGSFEGHAGMDEKTATAAQAAADQFLERWNGIDGQVCCDPIEFFNDQRLWVSFLDWFRLPPRWHKLQQAMTILEGGQLGLGDHWRQIRQVLCVPEVVDKILAGSYTVKRRVGGRFNASLEKSCRTAARGQM